MYASYNIPCATLEIAVFEAFRGVRVWLEVYFSRGLLGDWLVLGAGIRKEKRN